MRCQPALSQVRNSPSSKHSSRRRTREGKGKGWESDLSIPTRRFRLEQFPLVRAPAAALLLRDLDLVHPPPPPLNLCPSTMDNRPWKLFLVVSRTCAA